MSLFSEFMEHLAERRYKENDLSDITYALLLSDEDFKIRFFKFLDENINLDKISDIIREYATDDSRPDFIIKMKNEPSYLVEIKINDKNTHIAQYCQNEELCSYKKIYLSNYELTEEDLPEHEKAFLNQFTRKTWRELYEALDKANKEEQSDAISGYLAYIKSVCSIIDIEDMRLKSLVQLGQFKTYLRELIKTASIENLEMKQYKTLHNYSDLYSGTYFSVLHKKTNQIIYPWIGVYYGECVPMIRMYFEFASGWCSILKNSAEAICAKLKKIKCITCEDSSTELIVELNQEFFGTFQQTNDINQQKQILKDFFEQTFDVIKNFIK